MSKELSTEQLNKAAGELLKQFSSFAELKTKYDSDCKAAEPRCYGCPLFNRFKAKCVMSDTVHKHGLDAFAERFEAKATQHKLRRLLDEPDEPGDSSQADQVR